jgi:hypothetical protein
MRRVETWTRVSRLSMRGGRPFGSEAKFKRPVKVLSEFQTDL